MAESFKNTLDVVDSLWACDSSEAVFDIVAEYGRGLGFELAIIACCCPMLMSPRKSAPFHTNCPKTWVELYAQHDLLESSIVGQVAYERASLYFGDIMAETEVSISDRERAVLTLVARGKTNWEAGAALSISEYSVRDYLKALSAKLQTSNRTHTVARAMQLGLIAP